MSLAAGRLRHRVRIESYEYLLDSNGDVAQDEETGETSQAWALVAEVWAAIEPLSAREFIAAQATQSQISARIVIRHRSDLNAAMRIVHGTKIYNPQGFLADKDVGVEYLTIPCTEGTNEG